MTAPTQQQELASLAEVFHLMGDPSRLSILLVVLDGPRAVAEIAAETGLSASLVRHHLRFKDAPQMRRSTLKRFISRDGFDEHLELHRLDCLASNGELDNYRFVKEVWETLPEEEVRPPRLLTGHDLKAMGYEPGPRMGKILAAVEEAQLEGELRTPEQARAYVEKQFPLASGQPAGGKRGKGAGWRQEPGEK